MSVPHNNVNVYFYRQPISALVTSHHQALSKNITLKLQFRMDTLHYITNVYIHNVFHIKFSGFSVALFSDKACWWLVARAETSRL